MSRRNLCPNPALGVDLTGWLTGGGAPTREAVSGFVRPWAVRYPGNSDFEETPQAAVTAGQTYAFSVYARCSTVFADLSVESYIRWYNASGGTIQFDQLSLPQMFNSVIARLERVGTAPALAASASLLFGSHGTLHNYLEYTAMLVEQAISVAGYADGDSTGWAWDGTPGLSTSTETSGATRGTANVGNRDTSRALVAVRTTSTMTIHERGSPTMQKGQG